MTQEEFVEAFRHEFGGMIADAATHARTGGELSLRMRGWFQRVDLLLAKAYRAATAPAKAPDQQPRPQPKEK